jgi:hypothetical protein
VVGSSIGIIGLNRYNLHWGLVAVRYRIAINLFRPQNPNVPSHRLMVVIAPHSLNSRPGTIVRLHAG